LMDSSVRTRGRVSLVSQTPFILNSTLRENVLFGLPFEKEVYERVLDVCCLRQDIKQLGEFEDLTEIGERGVTLSGGTYASKRLYFGEATVFVV
jgi:ABC-type multidrug transport system fused ATPase/permease subunit